MIVRSTLHLLTAAMCCYAAVIIAFDVSDAQAHAIVIAAEPAMNATVAPGDVEIRLRFNSKIDALRSNLRLTRPDGAMVPVSIESDDRKAEIGGHVSATAEGRWTLHWQVLSLDGHITRGDVIFYVRR